MSSTGHYEELKERKEKANNANTTSSSSSSSECNPPKENSITTLKNPIFSQT